MFNLFAIFTIVRFRIKEFTSEYHYSILAPLTSNLLFVIIFSTIDRYYALSNENLSFMQFLIPGLIIMVVAQESFDNTSVSIVNSKQIGSFDDFLVAPVSRVEIFIAYLISQIFIGLFLGFLNFLILSFFISYNYFSLISFLYYLTLVIIFFSSLGSLVGFLAYRWDTISTVSNFFVSPINFLSGTFFSINALPENIKYILLYNPYYYLITYFRDSFYVKDEVNYYLNLIIFIFVFSFLLITAYVFHKGYKVIK
jgi:ABC-2 type transport system permease protein